jgi:hypothetical protein
MLSSRQDQHRSLLSRRDAECEQSPRTTVNLRIHCITLTMCCITHIHAEAMLMLNPHALGIVKRPKKHHLQTPPQSNKLDAML